MCTTHTARHCSPCTQDWKQHKKLCKQIQAETAAASTCVVVDLAAAGFDGAFVSAVNHNAPISRLKQSVKRGKADLMQAGAAAAVDPHPKKRFVVKIQAPLSGPVSDMSVTKV